MPSAIELFSGCGGLSTGLIAAGFEVLSAVEINQTAADTYGLNPPTVNLIVDDVRNVTAVSLLRRHNLRIGELDLLAGCSPCQGFSRLRKGESGSTDPRNQLVLEFLRLVRGLRPKTVFMENVPGLITTEYGEKLFKNSTRNHGASASYAFFINSARAVTESRNRNCFKIFLIFTEIFRFFHLIRETIVLCPNDSLKTWQFNIFYVSIISQFRHNCNEVFLSMSCISI